MIMQVVPGGTQVVPGGGSRWFSMQGSTRLRCNVAGQGMETDRSRAYTRAHAAPQQSTAGTASLSTLRLPCYVERIKT